MLMFPRPVRQNGGRMFFIRGELENYKLALAGLPPRSPSEIIEFVPATKVAAEFGFNRRTLGRLVEAAEAEDIAPTEIARAKPPVAALKAMRERREAIKAEQASK